MKVKLWKKKIASAPVRGRFTSQSTFPSLSLRPSTLRLRSYFSHGISFAVILPTYLWDHSVQWCMELVWKRIHMYWEAYGERYIGIISGRVLFFVCVFESIPWRCGLECSSCCFCWITRKNVVTPDTSRVGRYENTSVSDYFRDTYMYMHLVIFLFPFFFF